MKPSKLYEALHALIANVHLCTSGAHAELKSRRSFPKSLTISTTTFSTYGPFSLTLSIFGVYRGSPKTRPNGSHPSFSPPQAKAFSFSMS